MQQFLALFTNIALFVDLAISVLALSFTCALTYAMRWLPGKAADYKEFSLNAVALKHETATSKKNVPVHNEFVRPKIAEIEKKEAATIE